MIYLQEGEIFISETLGRLKTNTSAIDSVKSADLVIEAIVEHIKIKQELFKSLDEVAPRYLYFYVFFLTHYNMLYEGDLINCIV